MNDRPQTGHADPAARAGTDATKDATDRHARRLVALEVQVAELDRSRRRSLRLGPILLLVLANVTPLVIVRPKNDPDESYTLFQLLFGAVPAIPTFWFLLLAVLGLLCIIAAGSLGSTPGRRGAGWPVVAPGVGLLGLLAVLVPAVAAAGTKSTAYVALTPATALGAAAAAWLIVGALSLRD
jgi:hypothetical protein